MGRISKVVVCGSKKCGKTSILEQAIYGNVGPFPSTIEDIYVANVETDRGTREKIRFFDTEGIDGEAVKEVPRHLLTIADGFVIVYSIDDEKSFHVAEAIKRDIERNKDRKEVPIIVLGNKVEPSNTRKVDSVQALNWAAKERVRLFEVSSLDRQGLGEPFVFLSSKLNPPPNKSSFPQLTIGRKQTRPSSGGES